MDFETNVGCLNNPTSLECFDHVKMLTDEDIQLGAQDFFDSPNILDCFTDELQFENSLNGALDSLHFDENVDFGTLDQFLNKYDVKQEPSSPYSTEVSSPENETSIISIPDDDAKANGFIADTPPQTPPGLIDKLSNSPPRSTVNPIILSLNTVPTLTYVVPVTQTLSVAPIAKPCKSIQPKPLNGSMESNNNIPDVLIPDEIMSLQNDIFQVKQAAKRGRPKKTSKAIGSIRETDQCNLFERCAAALKRQEKMMKNRESATLSRLRKREYVQKLEERLIQMNSENSNLRVENHQLKQRISDLEKEILKLKTVFLSTGAKKTTCVLVAVFMLTFNLASLGSMFDRTNIKQHGPYVEPHRKGRILLWNEENSSREFNSSQSLLHNNFIKEDDETSYIVSWDKTYNLSSCQQYINQSESLRLEKDLLGWVKRMEKKHKQNVSKLRALSEKMKTALPLPKLQQLGLRHRSDNDIWAKKKNRNEILIYQTPREYYTEFFEAIHRREDSFYFISFSGDHLLLPAMAHNQTHRPRMSFVMPAMTLNDSVGNAGDLISMMQIDCEVVDTKLVYIKESVIPPHLRQKSNSTSNYNLKGHSRYTLNKNAKKIRESTTKLQDKRIPN